MEEKKMLIKRICTMCFLTLLFAGSVQAQDRPNILIIWGDDIGPFNISAYNITLALEAIAPITPISPGRGLRALEQSHKVRQVLQK
jgi:hypothetical protein